jgi:predicted Zn-dependent protease
LVTAVMFAVPMSFLKFSRNAEREADLLGLEYQYAAGYDPVAVVNFFEKIKAREKKKQNFISRAFSSHPMNDDRVKRAQQAMIIYLPERDQYLLTTSEFEEVKARLERVTSSRLRLVPVGAKEAGKPTLRKRQ